MGYSALGQCFPTVEAAGSAVCATYPKTAEEGGVARSYSCARSVDVAGSDSGQALAVIENASDGSAAAAFTLQIEFPICDPDMQTNDLVTLWSAGLAAVMGVYLAKQFIFKLVANQ